MSTEDDNHYQDLAQNNQEWKRPVVQYGSQTDEVSRDRHCFEASSNRLEKNTKLDKILTQFGEIESFKTRLANLEEKNKQTKN